MKKTILLAILTLAISLSNCTDNERDSIPLNIEINDFVWKGMNTYYLWQNEIPVLADGNFSSQEDLYSYLEGYQNPAELFSSLKYQPDVVDRWSWIVSDYIALEQYFSGVRKSSGAKIALYYTDSDESNLYGVIQYIVPGTDAASKPIQRGAVFNTVNGTLLNTSNYKDLIYNSDSYTLNLGSYSYNSATNSVEITATGMDVTLVKGVYTQNPIHKVSTFTVNGSPVGYLMYNSFTSNFNQELNNAFQILKNDNVTDLILDLRYNGGGSVQTAIYLAGMITGQFEGQILTQEQWNDKWQTWLEENQPDWLYNNFTNTMRDGTSLHSLNLSRVIVLTTGKSASASELIINGLKPYIDVVTIGTTTHGKYAASVTLYDSPDFSKDKANPDHLWAIQPIVLKEVNKLGNYAPEGFAPSIELKENFGNMGTLGEETEPLTARALEYIETGSRVSQSNRNSFTTTAIKSPDSNRLETEMYIEKDLPFEKL